MHPIAFLKQWDFFIKKDFTKTFEIYTFARNFKTITKHNYYEL